MTPITLRYFTGTPVELSPAETSLYGQLDRVRQATNAGIRRWVNEHHELLRGRVLDYGAGKPGTCRIPQPFRQLIAAADYVPWEPGDFTIASQDYDAILCTQVIQNVPDVLEMFRAFYAWLKPGGYLVMTYPVAWEEIETELWRITKQGAWMCCHRADLRVICHESLVRVDLDSSLNLALVNGLVAQRVPAC